MLTLASGQAVAPLALSPEMVINRTVALYGPSGTGKSVIIQSLLNMLQGHIDQVLVVSPTEPQNNSYRGFVDPPLIHYRPYLPDPKNPAKDDGTKGVTRFLEAVWKRQEMAAAINARASNEPVLARLYDRLPAEARAAGRAAIASTNARREALLAQLERAYPDPTVRADKKKKVNGEFKRMLVRVYKKFVGDHRDALWGEALDEDERFAVQYISFNPRLLLVFDDCAAQLKPMFNKEVFRLLFYQGRHSQITTVMAFQDDTDLSANLRRSAFISVFTDAPTAMASLSRTQDRALKKAVPEMCEAVFSDERQPHRKLAFIRDDPTRQRFYHLTVAPPAVRRFGSAALHELCDAIRNEGSTLDRQNPYYARFMPAHAGPGAGAGASSSECFSSQGGAGQKRG